MELRSKRTLLPLLMILPLTVGCAIGSGGSQSPCDKSSSINGSIQTISTASGTKILGTFLLDGTKEQQAMYDKISVSIDSATRIYEKHGQECRTVKFSALKTGQRVQIQTSGPVLQSYPPQTRATEVVILPGLGLRNPPV